MRVEFAQAIIDHHSRVESQVFFTGDLGYMALEKVRDTFGSRFINAGIAEQNMVSMAAAMAHDGFLPWVYSIAPFVTLRPYEQVRNDVCLHNLPVKLVGNGGGYGYGIMGGTHHNPEDIAVMRVLPNMKVYVPFTGTDITAVVDKMLHDPCPNYLRLNTAKKVPVDVPEFAEWRCLKPGGKAVAIGTGPVTANLFDLPDAVIDDIEIWVVSKLPVTVLPEALKESIARTRNVFTIEEHYAAGGLGEHLAAQLLAAGDLPPVKWHSFHASGYLSGKYGSQQWHQEENTLSGLSLHNKITSILQ